MTRAVAPIVFLAISLLVVIAAMPAYAQSVFPTPTADLSLSVAPNNPAPNSSVRLSVRSVLLDLAASDVTWYANDTVIASGAGVTETSVTMGPLGSETRIRIEAQGAALGASVSGVLRPTQVDLLWEGNSYVPPFYEGRALATAGGSVRLLAVPHFKRTVGGSFLKAEDLIYTWRKNSKIIQSVNGRGKNSAVIETPVLVGSDTISVEVRTADGFLQGTASVRIPSVEPLLVLYENHPIFGILYHRALQSPATVPEVETTFSAVPYYAPIQGPDDGSLVYRWRVGNSVIVNNPSNPSAITINAERTTGIAAIELAITHVSNFFMSARNAWNITLGGADPTSASSPFTDPFTSEEQ